ncbi:LacI family DNA-binding transcriptional regulator [Modestobacter sp. Leaf380]|uniref:LacI family DNA-binding transcriptional regulator n=1 Tax=Modestobacter sp. Leaf380 TaxID=1736356 RepID=UPI0006F5F2DE|nr:LacI family DNA-binding transcriptional regulator [Modestobacter sp. Leaf380]KQS72115.1 hypothetical protein ASG41_18795 [Modestobacter sp. Leaf380]
MNAIEEVARRAGVSRATVTRVVQGHRYVSAGTRARVQQVVQELDYRPSSAARTLASGRAGALGVVLGGPLDPESATWVAAVERATRLTGRALVVRTVPDGCPGSLTRAVQELAAQQVDGIALLCPSQEVDLPRLRDAAGTVPLQSAHDWEGEHNTWTSSGVLAVRHLRSVGHAVVHVVVGDPEAARAQALLRRSTVGPSTARVRVVTVGRDPAGTGPTVATALATSGASAVVAESDRTAWHLLSDLRRLGVRVPEDVALVSCGDAPGAAFSRPGLTVVRHHLAGPATRLVDGLLHGPAVRPPSAGPPDVELVVRGSCGTTAGRLAAAG